ncbi:trafficking regulator of GLUT4 1-like, partial [Syngnathoides biaculeatus]|uniref:trafficking regulator of GLUT4 1-like n=1 Tax=Syngnathoides biaculeatus TaxID=300417 RepID=UPI002ADD87B3
SRAGPPSSTAGAAPPPSYLWMAVLSCLCPGVPLNVCALWYASVSRSVLNDGDVEAARKYGRASLLLSCLAMLLGAAVIVFLVFTVGTCAAVCSASRPSRRTNNETKMKTATRVEVLACVIIKEREAIFNNCPNNTRRERRQNNLLDFLFSNSMNLNYF